MPAVPAGAVPASVAVPSPLSAKVTLVGNPLPAPPVALSARAAAGKPLEVTRNVPA